MCICVCIYVCMYVYVYIYIYITIIFEAPAGGPGDRGAELAASRPRIVHNIVILVYHYTIYPMILQYYAVVLYIILSDI